MFCCDLLFCCLSQNVLTLGEGCLRRGPPTFCLSLLAGARGCIGDVGTQACSSGGFPGEYVGDRLPIGAMVSMWCLNIGSPARAAACNVREHWGRGA